MSTGHDAGYWARRAEAELAQARRATLPAASKAHYELAGFYFDRAHGGEPIQLPTLRPTLSLVR